MVYMKTIKAKETEVKRMRAGIDGLKYEIEPGSTITFNHLLSLSLYTDNTLLCTDFSKSFRALDNFESLSSIKRRNEN